MRNVALLTPTRPHAGLNPGSLIITAGIRRVFDVAFGECNFLTVPFFTPTDGDCFAASMSDVLVMCGNPRFDQNPRPTWNHCGVWSIVEQIGIPFVDAWAGSCVGYPATDPTECAETLWKNPVVQAGADRDAGATLCIARDETARWIMAKRNPNTVLLPCCSWYAAEEMGVHPAIRTHNMVIVRQTPGNEWVAKKCESLMRELSHDLPTLLVAVVLQDYRWFQDNGVKDIVLVNDPKSMLGLLASADKVASFRLHSAIPAASLGCSVCGIYSDSRFMALEPFGIPSVPFDHLKQNVRLPYVSRFQAPSIDQASQVISTHLQPLFNK